MIPKNFFGFQAPERKAQAREPLLTEASLKRFEKFPGNKMRNASNRRDAWDVVYGKFLLSG